MKVGSLQIKSNFVLIAILIMAAVMRFHYINQPFVDAFSSRESSTAMMADNFYRHSWNIFYPEVSWGGAGPNYQGREFQTISYLAALLYTIFGQHEWVGRLLAIMFGLWGIFALYQLVLLLHGKQQALAAAGMMALLPGSIFIDRSFIPDPAMVSLIVTSLWMLVAYCQSDRLYYLILTSVICMLGLLTKITGLIVGIPIIYLLLTVSDRQVRWQIQRFCKIAVAMTFTLIPVVAYYLWARNLAMSYPPHHFAGDGNWLWENDLQAWLQKYYFLPDLGKILYLRLWTLPIILLLIIGLFSLHNDSNKLASFKSTAPWLFHLWLLSFALFYLVGAKEIVGNPWNLHIISPAVAVLAARGAIFLTDLISQDKSEFITFATIGVIVFIIGSFGQNQLGMFYLSQNEYYHLGLNAKKLSQPEDLVVSFGLNSTPIYYSQRRGWVFPPAEVWSQLDVWTNDEKAIQVLENLRSQGADWLLIPDLWDDHFHKPNLALYHPILNAYIKHTYKLELDIPEGLIYRFPKIISSS